MASTANRPRVLLVEPDSTWRAVLIAAAPTWAHVDSPDRFEAARVCLDQRRYNVIVANRRLGAYNGLHLAYVARFADAADHTIVYDERPDLGLARETHRAGALYELRHRLPITLPAYVGVGLPATDRRDPVWRDRRAIPRGGRRRWDRHILAAGAPP